MSKNNKTTQCRLPQLAAHWHTSPGASHPYVLVNPALPVVVIALWLLRFSYCFWCFRLCIFEVFLSLRFPRLRPFRVDCRMWDFQVFNFFLACLFFCRQSLALVRRGCGSFRFCFCFCSFWVCSRLISSGSSLRIFCVFLLVSWRNRWSSGFWAR